jgi:AraC family transcriptional regulator, regulatory protein of adaptative response / methylated-DNA-[protein]-cysteine methyltransferase
MNTPLTFQQKYAAILSKDSSFEGLFITAVKTTGIFCRPVCTARKPKPENVIFFDTANEALANGYRPCKICNPLEQAGATPTYIKQLLQELNDNSFLKINDAALRKRNIEPHQLRRWFKKHHNMTFHAYQRMLRINTAFNRINTGAATITDTAYDIGYESLSGFNESYRTIVGAAPTHAKEKTIINIVRFTTPLGPMYGCATTQGVCLVEFTNRRMLETEFKDLCKRLNAVILPGKNAHLDQLQQELIEYFVGTRKIFSVALHFPGSEFQQSVWKLLQAIPYGHTCSYKQQAIKLNKPQAVRAVASANGHNRIAILIPCHRVIGDNGHLTGYAGGLFRKKWLLDFEKQNL